MSSTCLTEPPPTEASPPETMAEEQSLASQPIESQVVMAEELARLLQELQSVQNTLAYECDYVPLVSKAYEKALQLLLASTNRLHNSIVSVMKMRLASLVLQYCWTRGI